MKEISLEETIKALEMLKAGKIISISPCKVFNPDCMNCHFYLCEGMVEWYYHKAKELAPKKIKKIKKQQALDKIKKLEKIDSPAPEELKENWEGLLNKAVEDWSRQGRTEEQIYGVINFLTGQGKIGIERIRHADREAIREWAEKQKNSTTEKDLMELAGLKMTDNNLKKLASISADIRQNVTISAFLFFLDSLEEKEKSTPFCGEQFCNHNHILP